MELLDRYQDDIARIAANPAPYPEGRFSGAGIVICAGGRTYSTCAWVLTKLLRSLGCRLPVEIWYRCPSEMNARMIAAFESVDGVRCVDASQVPGRPDEYKLKGWEIKAFAIANSSFREVLFLDCDNIPTRDPTFLLSCDPYKAHGAVFWPDRWMAPGDPYWTIHPEAWTACDVVCREEPELESGQMVIDKRRCWHALQLALFYNMHSSFFYRFMLGDKDTFHMAWRRLDQPFAMPMFRPVQDVPDGPVLYQHDFEGKRLFQHRNQDKWDYDGNNMQIPGFEHEERCKEFVVELRSLWDGVVRQFPDDYSPAERMAYEEVVDQQLLHYRNDGVESRLLQFRPDFTLGIGKGRWESHWEIEQDETGAVRLTLASPLRKMVVLDRTGVASWSGRCLHFERSQISLDPVSVLPRDRRRVAESIRGALPWLPNQDGRHARSLKTAGMHVYHRVGHDARPMEFRLDQTIGHGAGDCEQWWYVDECRHNPSLVIQGRHGTTCRLEGIASMLWVGKWAQFEEMPVAVMPAAMQAVMAQQDRLIAAGMLEDYYALNAAQMSDYYGSSAMQSSGYYGHNTMAASGYYGHNMMAAPGYYGQHALAMSGYYGLRTVQPMGYYGTSTMACASLDPSARGYYG